MMKWWKFQSENNLCLKWPLILVVSIFKEVKIKKIFDLLYFEGTKTKRRCSFINIIFINKGLNDKKVLFWTWPAFKSTKVSNNQIQLSFFLIAKNRVGRTKDNHSDLHRYKRKRKTQTQRNKSWCSNMRDVFYNLSLDLIPRNKAYTAKGIFCWLNK